MVSQQVTELLHQSRGGDSGVLNDVYEILYEEIKALAGFQLKQIQTGETITPTVLAHECYLKFHQANIIPIEDKRHFLNCMARSMRMYLIDVLRGKQSQKRHAHQVSDKLTELVGSEGLSFKLLEIDLALDKIESIDQRLSEILQYKLIFNLTFKEIADTLGVSERQVMRLWKQAKALMIALMGEQVNHE